jgi:hypothetical protein
LTFFQLNQLPQRLGMALQLDNRFVGIAPRSIEDAANLGSMPASAQPTGSHLAVSQLVGDGLQCPTLDAQRDNEQTQTEAGIGAFGRAAPNAGSLE